MNTNELEINWFDKCCNENLSEEFIIENSEHINWSAISEFSELSEDFIRKYKHKLNWRWIFLSQKLSDEFIKEFAWIYRLTRIRNYQIRNCDTYLCRNEGQLQLLDNKFSMGPRSFNE